MLHEKVITLVFVVYSYVFIVMMLLAQLNMSETFLPDLKINWPVIFSMYAAGAVGLVAGQIVMASVAGKAGQQGEKQLSVGWVLLIKLLLGVFYSAIAVVTSAFSTLSFLFGGLCAPCVVLPALSMAFTAILWGIGYFYLLPMAFYSLVNIAEFEQRNLFSRGVATVLRIFSFIIFADVVVAIILVVLEKIQAKKARGYGADNRAETDLLVTQRNGR